MQLASARCWAFPGPRYTATWPHSVGTGWNGEAHRPSLGGTLLGSKWPSEVLLQRPLSAIELAQVIMGDDPIRVVIVAIITSLPRRFLMGAITKLLAG